MTIHKDQHGSDVQAARPALSQNVAIGAASAQSALFQAGGPTNVYNPDGTVSTSQPNNTTHIRVCATVNCWIAFGTNPTAVVAASPSILIVAYTPEYFWVNHGERIAVIQDSSGGTLNVAELAQ
jgi:hypothetical protein